MKNNNQEIYLKEWFPTEKEVNDFAKQVNGTVHDSDFYGGYEVMYPKENEKIAQEILFDYLTEETSTMSM